MYGTKLSFDTKLNFVIREKNPLLSYLNFLRAQDSLCQCNFLYEVLKKFNASSKFEYLKRSLSRLSVN